MIKKMLLKLGEIIGNYPRLFNPPLFPLLQRGMKGDLKRIRTVPIIVIKKEADSLRFHFGTLKEGATY